MRRRTVLICLLVTTGLLAGGGLLALQRADLAHPPSLEAARAVSAEVVAADGQLLRAYAMPDGLWRLRTTAADVDPLLVTMLIAYEDRRFRDHGGIDLLALGRAAGQFVTHGRIVSGASTLSMQVARLIEPRRARSLSTKLRQMARAVQIERRLDKDAILDLYLTHAPYGGNLEGVRAASLAYFAREPKRLSPAEAALLVALPQLPERRRPDRFADRARLARDRVLERMREAGVLSPEDVAIARATPLPTQRLELPMLAAHLGDQERAREPKAEIYRTTIDKSVQAALEQVAKLAVPHLPAKASIAIMAADSRSGAILASVGSPDYLDTSRAGWIDMTRRPRSPGSTLKPMIYGLAFEQGLIAQATMIEDRPADFYGYRPKNFDMAYQGEVTVREALQLSLNVPAVRLLDAVGPEQLLARLRRARIEMVLPPADLPGLAIALGGVGTSLRDLMGLYVALSRQGDSRSLYQSLQTAVRAEPGAGAGMGSAVGMAAPPDAGTRVEDDAGPGPGRLLDATAAWNINDILSGMAPPPGSPRLPIAFKTGTSYGYRDAWSIGYDGRTVIGVWVGRPDNSAIPGISGFVTAAPILFEAFARAGLPPAPLPAAPAGTVKLARAELPVSQRRFSRDANGLLAVSAAEKPVQILYPPDGAAVETGTDATGRIQPLVLKLQAGRAPFRLLANGRALPEIVRSRTTSWTPEEKGYSTLTVIDAAGRTASIGVFIQ